MERTPKSFTRKLKSLLTRGKTQRAYQRLVNTNVNDVSKYKAAGSVFTDGKLILAGYQPKKRKPFISGIGGGKEAGETYADTAVRETLEELFEFKEIPEKLTKEIQSEVIPQRVVQSASYIMVVYDFDGLEQILKLIKKHELHSPLYDFIPTTLMDLLFKRKLDVSSENIFFKPELSHLALLPLVNHPKQIPFVDSYFIEDMPLLLK